MGYRHCASSVLGFCFMLSGMVMPQAFNGAGGHYYSDADQSFQLSVTGTSPGICARQCGRNGGDWSFYAIVVAESTMAIIGIWLFRKGKWKLKVV